VQAAAGILLLADPGDEVEAGQPLLELHTDTPDAVAWARAALAGGVAVVDEIPSRPDLLLATVR
jgi:thymidine phosphorylase